VAQKTNQSTKKGSAHETRALILWALLVRPNAGAFQNELRPEPKAADRKALEADGLITSEKRKQRIWIEVTDRGWEWAGRNLDAALPTKSTAGGPILQAWLCRLKAFLDAKGFALADILGDQSTEPAGKSDRPPSEPSAAAHINHAALRDRIRTAYLHITNGRLNTRALLSDIREQLRDIHRDRLDEALKQMQRDQEASLYQLDDRSQITDADRAAAIYFGGEPRHILWLER
jgi:hypothetical protein